MIVIVAHKDGAGTDEDILKDTRLGAIPYNGTLVIEAAAHDMTDSNNTKMTLNLPDGSVPYQDQFLCTGGVESGTNGGVLDERTKTMMSFAAEAGGHFRIDFTNTGTSSGYVCRVTLVP